MKHFKQILILLFLTLNIGVQAQVNEKAVVFYLKNLPMERIGTDSDNKIISDLEGQGIRVISVDCNDFPKTSPELETRLTEFHLNTPIQLAEYYTQTEISNLDIFYVPEGYTLKKHIAIWNIKDHGADGSLDRIMETYNKEIVEKYKVSPVTKPEDMVDKKGNPLDYNLYMHVIHPSGTASKKVPLVVNFGSSSQMQKGFNPVKPKISTIYRNLFPLGFLTTGYAWAHVDHCYNPLARDHVYAYFERYSLEDWNGLNSARAYIRYLREKATELNLNGKFGAMGVSKASYSTVRIADKNNGNLEERSLFNDTPNTKPQPWGNHDTSIDVAWAAAGLGTMRIAQYANNSTVPMSTSAGLNDEYDQWKQYPPVVKHLKSIDHNHLPMWMEDMGHDYPCMGTDLATGEKRYDLLKRYFDNYLKPSASSDPLEVFYIFPKENSKDVTNKGYSRILTDDATLPNNMSGVSPYAPTTIRFLSSVDLSEIAAKAKVYHTASNKEITGSWKASVNSSVFEFEPSVDLEKDEDYEIVVTAGLKDKEGRVLASNISRKFTVQTIIDEPEVVEPNIENYVFADDFERDEAIVGGVPRVDYITNIVSHSGDYPPAPSITAVKTLLLRNKKGIGSGRIFMSAPLSSYLEPFSTKLSQVDADSITWSFNLRHTTSAYFTADDSGFGPNQNGLATVLLATSSDIETASGYAIVVGDKLYGQRYRLVKFNDGLNDNSKLTNLASSLTIMGGAVAGADYHALMVVYIPSTKQWNLYFKNKESNSPVEVSNLTLVASGTDDNFMTEEMTHFGFLNNYNTTTDADRMALWDNYVVRVFDKETVSINDIEGKPYQIELRKNGIIVNSDNANLALYNTSGCLIKSATINNRYEITGMEKGVYLLKLDLQNGVCHTEKLIVN